MFAGTALHLRTNASPPFSSITKTTKFTTMMDAVTIGILVGLRDASVNGIKPPIQVSSKRFECLSDLGHGAARNQREHQAGCAAEKHADSHERAKHPAGARRPRSPNHHSQDQSNNPIQQ